MIEIREGLSRSKESDTDNSILDHDKVGTGSVAAANFLLLNLGEHRKCNLQVLFNEWWFRYVITCQLLQGNYGGLPLVFGIEDVAQLISG
jgi:hypothetical protein